MARDTQSLKFATRLRLLFVNDFPKQEMDSRPLPIKSSFTGECVHLQILSLAQFRTRVTKRSGAGRVPASSARRRADRAARRADERNLHANEGLDHCGVNLVLVRTVLEGTDLHVIHAIAQVHREILPTLGE